MATDLILPAAKNEFAKYVVEYVDRLLPLLNTSYVTRQQFASAIVVAANELKPGECTAESVLVAAAHAAMIGILPGRALQLAYFIPRKLRRTDPKARCNLEISYQGYCTLAMRNKYLSWVRADVVLDGEGFSAGIANSRPVINHELPLNRDLSAKAVRDRCVGAYCLFKPVTADQPLFHWMSRQQIDEVEQRGGKLWQGSFYPAMVRKTPVRHAAKFWQLTNELAMAVTLDEQTELGEAQDLGANLLPPPAGDKTIDLDAMDEDDQK